jgi:hypothetical protein
MRSRFDIPSVRFEDAKDKIRSGDLLSFHPCFVWYSPITWFTWLIAFSNTHRISHSAMACWWGDKLMCVQMQAGSDRIVLLSDYVRKWPGKIIVSKAKVPYGFNRRKAAAEMVAVTDKQYGWLRLLVLGFCNTFTGRWLYPNVSNDQAEITKWPPVCSEAYSRIMRLNGFDPTPERPDCRTEPHHLYESQKMKPLFVLV